MEIIADLHIHSKYSRATSKDLTLENLERYAKLKGINLMGTGDFQHPKWNAEIKKTLIDDGTGIYKTKTGYPFMLTSEISLIYSQDGKGRRNHVVLFAPSLEVVDGIIAYLSKRGRLDYDGRPIFKIPSNEFVADMLNIDPDIEIIPAHIWTPHFSVMGDYNQYKAMEDCFKDQIKNIHAFETGISSDPAMNWRLSGLDRFQIVSFSDSHSFWPWRLGREATIFDVPRLTYANILKAIRTGEGLVGTVESEPNFGKYHFTGHKPCGVVMTPKDAKAVHYICPKCHSKMPVGVADRIEELADRDEGFKPNGAKKFYSLIPLSELIAVFLGTSVSSQKAWKAYYGLVNLEQGRNEFDILIRLPREELMKYADKELVDVILKNRDGKIRVQPGYDGEYGIPLLKGEEVKTYKPTSDDKIIGKEKAAKMALTTSARNLKVHGDSGYSGEGSGGDSDGAGRSSDGDGYSDRGSGSRRKTSSDDDKEKQQGLGNFF